jgi:hypothetical protein
MDEYVLAAAFRRDESETFCRVEELDLTNGHDGFLLKALKSAANTMSVAVVEVAPNFQEKRRRRHSRPFTPTWERLHGRAGNLSLWLARPQRQFL